MNVPKHKYTEEIVCDISREATPYGAGYNDGPEMISEELARKMYLKAMAYRIECNVASADDENIVEFSGQAGLIRSDLLVPSPGRGDGSGGGRYKVYPVTAKHNMKAELGELLGTKIYSHALAKTKHVSFPEMGLTTLQQPMILKGSDDDDNDVELPFGLDFTFGSAIENPINSFTGALTSFSIIRHDFRIEKGQKVAIAVWRVAKLVTEGTIGRLSLEEEAKYYGPPDVPVIQTGVITGIYGNGAVFSHSINTYEGCSGAIIFLLDKEQPPESVQAADFGKAIGVHAAGYYPHNLGMAILDAYHNMTNPALKALA
jgi:hypothetical protein